MTSETQDRVLGGRYHIRERLGRGGTAVVYRADDERLGRPVALKLLDTNLDERSRERMEREARQAAALNHPYVVQVHDVVNEGGSTYLVMEYVEGTALDVLLRDGGALPEERVIAIARMLCTALAEAHAKGIVHRDIKPSNVLITPEGTAKLADFGTARMGQGDTLTEEGTLVGSAAYVAPEQVSGAAADGRADLYSLGVLLYELLTGVRPFDGDTVAAVVMQRLHRDPLPPSVHAEISPEIDGVVMRALAREPADRFQNAHDMAASLPVAPALVTDDLTTPLPVAPAGRVRRRTVLLLVGLFAAVFAGLAAASLTESQPPRPSAGDPPPVTMVILPDLSGLTVEHATAALEARGLEVASVREVATDAEEPGIVVDHIPDQGEVPPGERVHLLIAAESAGPAPEGPDAGDEPADGPAGSGGGEVDQSGDTPPPASGGGGTADRGGGPPEEPPGQQRGQSRGQGDGPPGHNR